MLRNVVISAIVIVAGLALIAISFLWGQNSKYQSENATPLRSILYGNNCSAPCWQHIAPGFTDVAGVTEMLNGVVDYQTLNRLTGEVHTISWWSNDTRLLPDGTGSITIVFMEDGTVLRVTARMDICVSTVLREYGEPARVESDGRYEYQLQYPDEGLFFVIGTANTTKTIVMVRTIQSEFPRTTNGLSWEEAETIFTGECKDSFSA